MRGESIGYLLVVEAGRAAGIITLADLLDRLPRRHRADRDTPPDLHFRAPRRKQHRAGGAW